MILKELEKLDDKYKMAVYILGNGKIDAYFINKKEREFFSIVNSPLKIVKFSSLEEGLKHAGKNCNKMIFTDLEKEDSKIIDKVYKKFGGYVSLEE